MFSIPRRAVGLAGVAFAGLGMLAAGCGGGGGGGPKIALLLPENKTARYETQDRPLFEKQVKKECPKCSSTLAPCVSAASACDCCLAGSWLALL